MQVSHNVLYKGYADSVHNQQQVDINNGSRGRYGVASNVDENNFLSDVFVKSDYLKKVENARPYIEGGFSDVSNFVIMANTLKNENILNNQDLIAAKYVANQTSDSSLSFETFNKFLKNDNLSAEMKSLISQLINKLHNINYVHAGLLMSKI